MDTINFSQFNTKFPLNTGDFLVGYDSTLLEEYKTNIIKKRLVIKSVKLGQKKPESFSFIYSLSFLVKNEVIWFQDL